MFFITWQYHEPDDPKCWTFFCFKIKVVKTPVFSQWTARSQQSLGTASAPLNSMLFKMVLRNSKRPRSDFSLSLFEPQTETHLLQSMTNGFGKMSKLSKVALCYTLSEQIWTHPLLIHTDSMQIYTVQGTYSLIQWIYWHIFLFSWIVILFWCR